MRTCSQGGFARRMFNRLAAAASLTLAATLLTAAVGCTGGGGGFLASGQNLTPQAEYVVNHAPKVPAVGRELQKIVLPDYTVEPGDTILIEPIRFDSPLRFSADQTIQPDGTVDLGKYGRLVVAGRRVEEIEMMIEPLVNADPEIIEDRRDSKLDGPERVNVRLINPAASQFYVLGAVNSPGAFPLAGRETALDAILLAGGLADNAKPCHIILSRPSPVGDCRTVLPICYDNIVQLGDSTTNYQLLPGDRIFVPASGFCEKVCSIFCKDDCCRCCYPQCPCGYATVRCPNPTTYSQHCPPFPGELSSPAQLNGPTPATDVPPAPSGPDVLPPAAPAASAEIEPISYTRALRVR